MKKIILMFLVLVFSLSLVGCTPKSDKEEAYLGAQKESTMLPGTISLSIDGTFSGTTMSIDFKGNVDSNGNALISGIAKSPKITLPINMKMYMSKDGVYTSVDNGINWSKTSQGFSSLNNLSSLPYSDVKNSEKISKVYDGKNSSVYKYDIDLQKSIDKLGVTSLLGSGKIGNYNLKNSSYNVCIDPKTKKLVSFDLAFSSKDATNPFTMKMSYTADSKSTVVKPDNLT